jgi:cytochrome c oxidase assembly factor CtaG
VTPPPYSFSWEPLFIAVAAAAVFVYARRARSERPPASRTVAFGAGIVLLVAPLNSPLETLSAHYLVLMHLTQNAITADWAPLLLILGLTPAMRAELAERLGRPFERVTRPAVAVVLWLLIWYATHLGGLYDFALRHGWALNVQHAALVAAGLLFWWPVVAREQVGMSTPGTLAYLGAAFAGSLFLGLALIFSSTAFYDYYASAPRLWGLSRVKDQNYGGIVMNAEQTVVFLSALTYFLLRLLDEEESEQRAREAMQL